MGLSKLSEKCQVCYIKDSCGHKRMEACAYITPSIPSFSDFASGGIVGGNHLFFTGHDDIEIVGSFGRAKLGDTDKVTDEISKAVANGIMAVISNVKAN